MRNMQSTPYGDYRQWDYHYLLPGAPGTDMDGLWQGSASGTMHAAFRVLFSHCLDSFRKTGRKNSKLKKPLYIERTAWEPSDLSDPLKKKTLLSLFIYNHSSTYSSTYLLHITGPPQGSTLYIYPYLKDLNQSCLSKNYIPSSLSDC